MKVKHQRLGFFPDDAKTIESAMGLIGPTAAQYFAFVRLEKEMPKFEQIVRDPANAKLPTKPDSQMLVVFNLGALAVDTKSTQAGDRVYRAHAEGVRSNVCESRLQA